MDKRGTRLCNTQIGLETPLPLFSMAVTSNGVKFQFPVKPGYVWVVTNTCF